MKLKPLSVFTIVLLLVLTACQGNQTPSAEPGPPTEESESAAEVMEDVHANTAVSQPTPSPAITAPEPSPEPTIVSATAAPETAVIQSSSETVTIEAVDGLVLHATYFGPGGTAPFPGVILLHMLGGNRQVWADNGFADALTASGYAVLALDMRGHGESGSDQDWTKAGDDLQRVWAYFTGLENVDAKRTAVIGASIGSNMALRTGADEPAIKTVALLSPGLDYRGVTTEEAMTQFGQRPILIVASEEDSYSANSSRTLAEIAQGEIVLQLYDGAGHGTNMINRQPDLTDLLLDWLDQHLQP